MIRSPIRWLKRLWCFRHRPIHVMQLPAADGWLANYVLKTLSNWHRQNSHNDILMLRSEDIRALAQWAADLQKMRAHTVWWTPFWKMRVKELPAPIQQQWL